MENNENKNNNGMDFNALKEQIANTEDVTGRFAPDDIAQNKVYAILATFPILFWVPIAVKGDSAYGKFYANQGLTELILVVALNILNAILGAILKLIPFLGGLLSTIIGLACGLVILAVWLFLFVNALNGKAKPIPLVGDLITVFK